MLVVGVVMRGIDSQVRGHVQRLNIFYVLLTCTPCSRQNKVISDDEVTFVLEPTRTKTEKRDGTDIRYHVAQSSFWEEPQDRWKGDGQ